VIILSDRSNYSSGTPWESIAGYSRVVRVGNIIEVAGTTVIDTEGQIISLGDFGIQTDYIFSDIKLVSTL
tara:strand:- start:20 stop:229 length:210 start_codon:yes stop_codon:yes gene_type:complete